MHEVGCVGTVGELQPPDIRVCKWCPFLGLLPAPSSRYININTIFDSLFASCAIHAHEAIASGLIARDDVESLEPFVFIGGYSCAVRMCEAE